MICPHCGFPDQLDITDTRSRDHYVKRRRKCLKCGCRFTTLEIPAMDAVHTIEEIVAHEKFSKKIQKN